MLFLSFSFLIALTAAENCSTCLSSWAETEGHRSVNPSVQNAVNCPMTPQPGYEYDDSFGRYVALPHHAAAYLDNPTKCFQNQLPSTRLYKTVLVNCDATGNASCFAYAAYDPANRTIAVVFRGTQGNPQFLDEVKSLFQPKAPFFKNGHIYRYWYDAFNYLWTGGLEKAVSLLKSRYPAYDLYAFGHSLGGSLATVFASYVVKIGMYPPEKVRLLTFGEPRTGDQDFAQWHDNTFLYSYRVVHHMDPAPKIPFIFGRDHLWHHRYEVWYNNNMTEGMPYQICEEGDGFYCSNRQFGIIPNDHVVYFNRRLGDWAALGCPNDE